MKLLLVDTNDLPTIAREEILRDQYHYDVDAVNTFDDFRNRFSPGKYHIVILNFAMDAGAQALDYIDETSPDQRVIVISESETYSEPLDCAHCVAHYNRRRLKEPIAVMDLDNLIRDFDDSRCAYFRD